MSHFGPISRRMRKHVERMNKSYPPELVRVPPEHWPVSILPPDALPHEMWRSRDFVVLVYYEDGIGGRVERLSIMRTAIANREFADGISWLDLQRLKRECGRGDRDAVEIYPADADLVNVANMRHLWVLMDPFHLTWRNRK